MSTASIAPPEDVIRHADAIPGFSEYLETPQQILRAGGACQEGSFKALIVVIDSVVDFNRETATATAVPCS